MRDELAILGLTVACCVVTGLAGLALLRALRHRSLRWQLGVVAVWPTVAVSASVAVNVRLMFLSEHDSVVIVVALATSLVLAFAAVTVVLRRITSGSRLLGTGVSRLVDDSAGRPAAPDPTAGSPVRTVPELEQISRELEDARRTLADSRERERNAERARRELVSFMSHDLRTPLAGLRALTEGLEDGMIADVPRAHAQLRATVRRMSGLVGDLFELSRLEATPAIDLRPLSLTELVADVTDELTPMASAAGVRLHTAVPEQDRLAVSGDAEALARALVNLVGNAVRHTGPGGVVDVRAGRSPAGRLEIAVTDGCGGIPEAHLARVFDTGWRGTPARTAAPVDGGDGPSPADPAGRSADAGAGLGLSITRRVVSAHAGSIDVRNVAGGCCFSLDLPAGQPSAA